MTDQNKRQISAVPVRCSRLGTRVEKDGIVFAADIRSKEKAELLLYRKGTEEIAAEIPFSQQPYAGTVHALKVKGISPKEYEYNFRIGGRVTVDPSARLITGKGDFGDTALKGEHQIRGGFVLSDFEWGPEEQQPQIPWEDVISYQLHVRGFTMQKNSRVRHKGTFLGLQEKIPYLKELGINQVILMPAYEFEEFLTDQSIGGAPSVVRDGDKTLMQENTRGRKLNYWGYAPGYYYVPKASYSAAGKPDREFKTMVKAFHENGMEVVMQFCFPDPVDLSLVSDCLIWWIQEYHVDGFWLLMDQEAANRVAGNPFLTRTKLISGYFPADRIRREEDKFLPVNLAECNDGFQVDIRKLLKGDEDMLTAFVSRLRYHPENSGVLNHVTNHDGFTLMDLVSYDKKHNEENFEQGRDGSEYNFSWNCGAEGPTRKKKILELRMQQMKNAFAMVLLAQGTPMLLAGDEFGNSQGGNNNPYCLDNEVSWVDWSRERANQELTDFVKALIAFRKEHKILHMEKALTGGDSRSVGYPDVSCHGSKAWYGGFEPVNRHVGLMYCGKYAGQDEFIYVAYNLHWESQELALPYLPEGMEWKKVLDTGAAKDCETGMTQTRQFTVPARTIQVLLGCKKEQRRQTENSETKQSAVKRI